MNQNTGQAQFLFHAAGKIASQSIRKRQKVGKTKVLFHAMFPVGTRNAENIHKKVHIFFHGQILVKAKSLGHVTDDVLYFLPAGHGGQTVYHNFAL